MERKNYDVIIIGGGIAGMTAAIYCARANLSTLILEQKTLGGLVNSTWKIENFPSLKSVGGMDLMEMVREQVEYNGADIEEATEVESFDFNGQTKEIVTFDGAFTARAVIVATGREPRRLPIKTDCEQIHYCAICDGSLYKGKKVLVVGGGNAGVEESIYMCNLGVAHITIIEQLERLFANEASQREMEKYPIESHVLTSVRGLIEENGKLKGAVLVNGDGEPREIQVDGIFVYMGQDPQTDLFSGVLEMEKGYIVGGEDMETNVPGVFVAGDVRTKKIRQITTAMNDGTIAAISADSYIRTLD